MKRAKKSLSQNFLKDKNICKKILKQTNINNRIILEIGPGYGFLTDTILENKPKKMLLLEKDRELVHYLKKKYKNLKNIIIIEEDILNFKLDSFENLIIISNLPYNISTKIILYLFDYHNNIQEMIFMIQKEVADKFNYNVKNMNKYKFLTKIVCYYSICFNVSPKVFFPVPKVDSTVIKFIFKKQSFNLSKAKTFSNLVFRNVRKKISNNIEIKNCNNNLLNKRVNELSIKDLFIIYNSF